MLRLSFLINNEKLLKKCKRIWIEIEKIIGTKKINHYLVFGDKKLKTKIKFYNKTSTANLKNVENNNNKPPKKGCN